MNNRVRRVAGRRIRRSVSGGAVTTTVDGSVVGVWALGEWASRTTHSKVLPAMLGMIAEEGSVRVVWLSRGHLWSCGLSVGVTEVSSATGSTRMRSLSRDPTWREFEKTEAGRLAGNCLLYTSPSPRDY